MMMKKKRKIKKKKKRKTTFQYRIGFPIMFPKMDKFTTNKKERKKNKNKNIFSEEITN